MINRLETYHYRWAKKVGSGNPAYLQLQRSSLDPTSCLLSITMKNPEITCPVCDGLSRRVFEANLMKRYDIGYYFCENCGMLRTEKPYWLEEAYSSAILDTDTGLVSRNAYNSRITVFILELLGIGDGRFLDIAGGYGLLARMMRDAGYDCYTTDQYCENLFAKSFEPDENFKADCLFAFEVMEHIEAPYLFLETNFSNFGCRNLFFSTLTYGPDIPARGWWYYLFNGGQHISFYQRRTLAFLARKLGCHYYCLGSGLHFFSAKRLPVWKKVTLENRYARFLVRKYLVFFRRRHSKTWVDHRKMVLDS